MELNRKSGLPLHAQAEQLIRELISSEEYKNGKFLPKEVDGLQGLRSNDDCNLIENIAKNVVYLSNFISLMCCKLHKFAT